MNGSHFPNLVNKSSPRWTAWKLFTTAQYSESQHRDPLPHSLPPHSWVALRRYCLWHTFLCLSFKWGCSSSYWFLMQISDILANKINRGANSGRVLRQAFTAVQERDVKIICLRRYSLHWLQFIQRHWTCYLIFFQLWFFYLPHYFHNLSSTSFPFSIFHICCLPYQNASMFPSCLQIVF